MARPWSARCYGVARQREGSRQNSIGPPACFLSGIFRAGFLYPLARGCRRIWRGEGYNYGLWLRRRRRRFRFQLAEGDPRLSYLSPLAREGADGQAVVCPLLRGSSPTRGVAPKQHRASGVLSLRHFSGWFSLSLGAWVPKNLARRRIQLWLMASAAPSAISVSAG